MLYTYSSNGLSNTEPQNKKMKVRPFTTLQKKEKKICPLYKPDPKKKVIMWEQNHACPILPPLIINLRVFPPLLRRSREHIKVTLAEIPPNENSQHV